MSDKQFLESEIEVLIEHWQKEPMSATEVLKKLLPILMKYSRIDCCKNTTQEK